MTEHERDARDLTILRHRDEGMSIQQTADVMGLSKGAVAGQLRRIDRDFARSEA